ncbi:hypothetical protein J4N02_11030 [Propioniciclava sp. MC1595]|uniref:DUF6325 family protein n=1 Tax=unclassified Propioniciclava TaxID=2642922 RepID=UPI0015FF0258|nr:MULTISPECIES: DUF6325 family protein [unclassified Propioniciclava]MBB1493714.1 hypothetical protein [Propioniciclava sp. MC1595]MBB1502885.1 hypothetical protein [Propioniciclava sp. MC1683]QTE25081.1 hypothetical protein J4N02_11030 [Propioniciclava sp. MC1595]
MPLAPVEFALFAFDDTRITGDIVPALTALVENELVHIIDLVFVRKEADGQVTAFELDDLPADAAAAFADLDHDIEGLVSTEDLDHEADLLEPGTSAIIVVWENLWAQRFTDAVRAAGGVLVDNQRIPAEVVEAALADELADRNLT